MCTADTMYYTNHRVNSKPVLTCRYRVSLYSAETCCTHAGKRRLDGTVGVGINDRLNSGICSSTKEEETSDHLAQSVSGSKKESLINAP